MKRVLHVALREFLATVATRGFLLGILMMPIIVGITIVGVQSIAHQAPPRVQGEVALVDHTGAVSAGVSRYLAPAAIAARRDTEAARVEDALPETLREGDGGIAGAAREGVLAALRDVPELTLVALDPSTDVEEAKRQLVSAEGRRLALVVVHPDSLERKAPDSPFGSYDLFVREKLDDRIVDEIRTGLRETIVELRVSRAGLDRELVEALTWVPWVDSRTVTDRGEEDTNEALNVMLPAAFMLLLFVSVMTGGQALLTTTVEEKSSRVVEVLLSAISPMQLMAGKILGQLCVGFVVMAVYGGMGAAALVSFALLGVIDPWLLLYLVIFYLIAHFVIGSLLAAIGAAVNDMREAQSLMGPVMMVLMIPWLLWMPISRAPSSAFAVAASFVPPINPFVMLIRMASSSPPPLWQVWLSILVGLVSVYAALWFASKVFRVGVLMYGKPPDLRTLVRWVRMA